MNQGLLLILPVAIAAAAVALMIGATSSRSPRRLVTELGYKPAPGALSLTPARYVGGHPAVEGPLAKPHVLLTDRDLAVFVRPWGMKLFTIPWPKIEQISVLTRPQMEAAAVAVRGLAKGAIEAAPDEARFLRVRFEDERGWWQHLILELSPTLADQQATEVDAAWRRHRDTPTSTPVTAGT